MVSYPSAWSMLLAEAEAKPLGTETIDLADIDGRILSESVTAIRPNPAFTNSAMDGFAVDSGSFSGEYSEWEVVGIQSAGGIPASAPNRHQAVEIMTGAPVPAGTDTVLKVEEVEVLERDATGSPRRIRARAVASGQHVRKMGEDILEGATVLTKGTRLGPQHSLALATLGVAQVQVRRRPKISLIATGPELVEIGTSELLAGQIYNSTAPYLKSLAKYLGWDVSYHGIVGDSPEDFKDRLENVIESAPDVILTTGAVSMGRHDYIQPTLQAMGTRILFHKVGIRPGKPILFGIHPHGPAIFGFPGNPISTVVGSRFFLMPYLRAAQGAVAELPRTTRLLKSFTKPQDLRCFFRARVNFAERACEILAGQGSHLIHPLLEANGWVVLPEGRSEYPAGEPVETLPLFPVPDEVL